MCFIVNIFIPGDGIEDMFVIDNTQMSIFAGTFQGGFKKDRDDRSYETLWPEAENGDTEFRLQVDDLNRDGLADLIVTQIRGGVKSLESNIKIYLFNAR